MISEINYSANPEQVEIERASVDGIVFQSSGIHVLPGKHDYSLNLILKEPPRDCETRSDFDYYAFESCRDRRDEEARREGGSFLDCDCYDYVTVIRECLQDTTDATCDGTIETLAGVKYQLGPVKVGGEAKISVDRIDNWQDAGKGSCFSGTSSTNRVETNLGTGRWTANNNGIYSCR
jgi:hypothetical protein